MTATATRLIDYRPPAWRIVAVALRFELDFAETRVFARLSLERHPARDDDTPLRLHGEDLETVALRLDGRLLASADYRIDEGGLEIAAAPSPCVLESEVLIRPEQNTRLEGLYRSGEFLTTQCEAEGFRRITWFIDRPDVMATYRVRLEADRTRFPVLLANGNPGEQGRLRVRPSLRRMDRPVAEAELPVRDRRRAARVRRRPLPHHGGTRRAPAHLRRGAGDRALRACDGEPEARDDLGRAGVRSRLRSGRVQHRRDLRLQHGRDGEQGPQHLQRQGHRRRSRDRDRCRPRLRRSRGRARVLPQLDRQSRHLPRLVPAVAEGRPDRLPRPGVLGRPGFARGQAHRRCAPVALAPVSRGRRPVRASGAPGRVQRDQQFLHLDRVRQGRGSGAPVSHPARPRRLPSRHGPVLRSGTTARP